MPAALMHSSLVHANDGSAHLIADVLYHFGLSTLNTDFSAVFADLKFVCTGGSAGRMSSYAKQFAAHANFSVSENLCKSDRYVMYKTGPVLWVNHGMGVPSLSIMLIELFKLLTYAGARVKIIRVGTSGGVGVPPGTVVIASGVMNGALEQKHVQWIHGVEVKRDAQLDQQLGDKLYEAAKELNIPVERGLTFCADDFYEGQMRLDGYFCEYSREEKLAFMHRLNSLGVKNIEMESTGFAAFTYRAKIPAAICCVTLLNRMENDTVTLDKNDYFEFEKRPFKIVCHYILSNIQSQEEQDRPSYIANGTALNAMGTMRAGDDFATEEEEEDEKN